MEVGHWVLLIRHSETKYEYFDCLAMPPPENILRIFQDHADLVGDVKLEQLSNPVMKIDEIDCGKWVMIRINSLPTPLKSLIKFFDDISEKYSPSVFVKMFYNLPDL